MQFLQEQEQAFRAYESAMRAADLADADDEDELKYPGYAWDNPIGLAITEPLNANEIQ